MFDLYRSPSIPAGTKSLAFALAYLAKRVFAYHNCATRLGQPLGQASATGIDHTRT